MDARLFAQAHLDLHLQCCIEHARPQYCGGNTRRRCSTVQSLPRAASLTAK
jgi:hypothetical protein